MSDEIRYIVLGQAAQVGEWRRERGLPCRRVIDAVRQPRLLVGLAGPLQIVFLPSWALVEWRTAMHVLAQIEPLRQRGEITTGGMTMASQTAAAPTCAPDPHVWVANMRGGEPIHVEICMGCGQFNWDGLREQAELIAAATRRAVCAEERHREVETTTLGQTGKTFRCARCGETREQAPPPPCPACGAAVYAWNPHRDAVEDYHDGPFDRYRPGPLELLLAPCGHKLRLQAAVDYAGELKRTTGESP